MEQNDRAEKDVISLLDEEGKEHEFEIVDALELDDRQYLALVPLYDESQAAEALEDSVSATRRTRTANSIWMPLITRRSIPAWQTSLWPAWRITLTLRRPKRTGRIPDHPIRPPSLRRA